MIFCNNVFQEQTDVERSDQEENWTVFVHSTFLVSRSIDVAEKKNQI